MCSAKFNNGTNSMCTEKYWNILSVVLGIMSITCQMQKAGVFRISRIPLFSLRRTQFLWPLQTLVLFPSFDFLDNFCSPPLISPSSHFFPYSPIFTLYHYFSLLFFLTLLHITDNWIPQNLSKISNARSTLRNRILALLISIRINIWKRRTY